MALAAISEPNWSTVANTLPDLTSGRIAPGRVVEADDQDLAALAGRVDRLDHAQRHRAVGGHDALDVRMRGQDVGEHLVGFFSFPVGGARNDRRRACRP